MAKEKEEKKVEAKKEQLLTINAGTVVGSTYAQVVSVTVTKNDITLDFIYWHPREGTEDAQVVSRVTLPKAAGNELIEAINKATEEHLAKEANLMKKEKK